MKLFVVNSPYWCWAARPNRGKRNRRNWVRSDDPLDEHHTYLYHLFLEYDLVDEVVVYSMRQEQDKLQGVPAELEFFGKPMRVAYDADFKESHQEKNQVLFCRQYFKPLAQFPQHLRVVRSFA